MINGRLIQLDDGRKSGHMIIGTVVPFESGVAGANASSRCADEYVKLEERIRYDKLLPFGFDRKKATKKHMAEFRRNCKQESNTRITNLTSFMRERDGCKVISKKIPNVIEKMGRAWMLISQAHSIETPTKQKKYAKARSLLWDAVEDGFIMFEGHPMLSSKSICEEGACSIDIIKGTIHTNIGEYFDMELHRCMRACAGRKNVKTWEDVVEMYEGRLA